MSDEHPVAAAVKLLVPARASVPTQAEADRHIDRAVQKLVAWGVAEVVDENDGDPVYGLTPRAEIERAAHPDWPIERVVQEIAFGGAERNWWVTG